MKVVGLDISLTGTGVAVHEPGGSTFVQEFGEDGHKGAPLIERHARLSRLRNDVLQVASGADLVVVESHDFGVKVSASTHDRSGVWWQIIDDLMVHGVPVAQATPQTLKMYLTGSGSASKDTMLATAVRHYPTVNVMTNNQADAMAALSMGVRRLELAPLEAVWNQTMARAMEKVEWPT